MVASDAQNTVQIFHGFFPRPLTDAIFDSFFTYFFLQISGFFCENMLHWQIYHDYLTVKSVFYVYVYGKDRREGERGGGRADILINMLSTPRCSNTVPKLAMATISKRSETILR